MTHQEVRMLLERTKEFASYLAKERIKNGNVNYAVAKNLKILSRASEEILSGAPAEMKELEEIILTKGKALAQEEDSFEKVFDLGHEALSQEEKDKYKELSQEFGKFLSQEDDVVLYKMKEEELKECPLELSWMLFAEEFFT